MRVGVRHDPVMRSAPSLIVSSGSSHFRIFVNSNSYDHNTMAIALGGAMWTNLTAETNGSIPVGYGVELGRGDSGAYLGFSAEL